LGSRAQSDMVRLLPLM